MVDQALPSGVTPETVGLAIRRIVRLLVESGVSYSQMSEDFARYFPGQILRADTIRKFVQRPHERTNVSETLSQLFRYLQAAKNSFSPFIRESIVLHTDVFFSKDFVPTSTHGASDLDSYDFYVANSYRLLARMLGVEYALSRRPVMALEGMYVCVRASTRFKTSKRIVVSRATIGPKPKFPDILEFRHHLANNLGERRDSDGFILGLGSNVVAVADIEFGRGLEMMTLRPPLSPDFDIVLGLISTLDTNGYPTCTRVVLKKLASDLQSADGIQFLIGPQEKDDAQAELKKLNVDLDALIAFLPEQADTIDVHGTARYGQ